MYIASWFLGAIVTVRVSEFRIRGKRLGYADLRLRKKGLRYSNAQYMWQRRRQF